MTEQELYNLKYPIGKFNAPSEVSDDNVKASINYLEMFPNILQDIISSLDKDQLNTPYRPDGWTLYQVVHHLSDSHVNAYVRLKLAATEETPTIHPYDEAAWAELEDGKSMNTRTSLKMLSGVHGRLVSFARKLTNDQLAKAYYHPADKETVSIRRALCMYNWHSKHHLGHITSLILRQGW